MTTTSKTFTIGDPIKKEQPNIQYGWKCPTCGATMAPWQNSCVNCIGAQITAAPIVTWDSTGNPNHWCDQEVTCKATSDTITTAWSSANTTPTNNSLKSAMKSHGINI